MPDWWLPYATTAIATIVVIATLLLLDWWGHDFKNSALLIAVLPVLIWLLLAGKIGSFKAFGVEIDSINELSKESVYADGGALASIKIDYQTVEEGLKVDPSQIQSFVQKGITALGFEIGRKNYYDGSAIAQWMANDSFKWVIFVDDSGRFKGLMPSANFRAAGGSNYASIKERIEKRDVFDLPGFVGQEWALTATSTNGEAVDKFSNTDANDLPVIDAADRKFKGVVNRARLSSKLLAGIFRVARTAR